MTGLFTLVSAICNLTILKYVLNLQPTLQRNGIITSLNFKFHFETACQGGCLFNLIGLNMLSLFTV